MIEVITANQQAKQQMNKLYLDATGAETQLDVIQWFIKNTLFFQIASVIFSAFGFFYDFRDALGIIGAGILGLGIGVFIEVSRHKSINGAFSSFKPLNKMLMAGVAIILMVIAVAYHFKSLKNFENISVKDTLKEQVLFERDQLKATNANINALIANNTELAKVLNNGKGGDDLLASNAMLSNADLMSALTTLNGSSYATNLLMEQSTKSAKQTANTLLLLFVTMEFFAVFGVIGKFMLNHETDKSVKEVATTMDKLNTIESNVYMATETALINSTMGRINEHLNKEPNHSPTSDNNGGNFYQNQPNFNFLTNAYKYAPKPENTNGVIGYRHQGENKPKEEPKTEAKPEITNDASIPSTEENDNLKENLNDAEKVLDLMMYNYQDSQIILALFDNGSIGKGERLVKKSLVLAELEDQGVKEDDYVTLLRRLKKQKLVKFDMGYISNCELKNIVKVG